MDIPEKTIERLSKYRRCLQSCLRDNKRNIYSHELALMLHITPVQVRRDMMLIGYTGTLRKGYDTDSLIQSITKIIDSRDRKNVCIVGLGNLGKAILNYMQGKSNQLLISAAFDVNPDKVNRMFGGIPCYDVKEISQIVKKQGITIAIISVPGDQAQALADLLVRAGVKGILNYTTVPLKVDGNVFLEEYDMITSLEKVAYFAKINS